ncbi:hypothetical protein B0O99DRAFT_630118 [Bisporella sp. PMI_857]|nr:hypothetical protein B0O99DRAFT_630118 [Bisporella sp. PMI_857]
MSQDQYNNHKSHTASSHHGIISSYYRQGCSHYCHTVPFSPCAYMSASFKRRSLTKV